MSLRVWSFHPIYSDWIQASPTLDLVNDCFRFVIAFFEVINTSAPHIYHSALPLSPLTSMINNLYKRYARPLVRVVQGLPMAWDLVVATVRHEDYLINGATWSPCNRFIAIASASRIEVLDAATLERLNTFGHNLKEDTRWFSFSPDSRSLTLFSSDDWSLTTWDLQTGGRISAFSLTPHTSSPEYFSSTYSIDGSVIAVAHADSKDTAATAISIYNLYSGTHIYSHHVSEGRIVASIWTHGESLRFVTTKPGSITIREAGFASIDAPAEVESLSAPDDIGSGEALFLPGSLGSPSSFEMRFWYGMLRIPSFS